MSLEQKQAWMQERHQAQGSPSGVSTFLPSFAERHYTVAEVAALWNLSPDSVRRIFEREAGILVLGETGLTRHKRRYRTLRIPQAVLERVHRRLCTVVGG